MRAVDVVVFPAYLGIVGAAMGSFVDALTYRLHSGRSVVRGRSQCETCGDRLTLWALVPVVSWVVLRGRCGRCHAWIGVHSPVVELTLAGLFVLSYRYWPSGFHGTRAKVTFLLWLCYLVLLASVALHDARWLRVPNVLVLALLPVVLLDAGLRGPGPGRSTLVGYTGHMVLGAVALSGVYAALHVFSAGRLVGFGDVKLSAVLGLALSWKYALVAVGLANVLGAVMAVVALVVGRVRGAGPVGRIPLAPCLAVAFLVVRIHVAT